MLATHIKLVAMEALITAATLLEYFQIFAESHRCHLLSQGQSHALLATG